MSLDTLQHEFIHSVSKSNKDNTYKLALAKFLLDFAHENKVTADIEINYSTIAEAFLKYYWFQECKYKFKQDSKTNDDPAVIKAIRKYCGTEYIHETYEKYFEENKHLKIKIKNEITTNGFKDVIPRFQSGHDLFYIHTHSISDNGKRFRASETKSIVLRKEGHSFLKQNYVLLNHLTLFEWAKFIESRNFSPRIISKIENQGIETRKNLSSARKRLEQIQGNCFYCEASLTEKQVHVDHFIPWSYIYTNDDWNFVLACEECNRTKTNNLAPLEYLKKIVKRNHENNLIQVNKDIEELYSQCFNAGFKKIRKEKLLKHIS